MLHAMPSTVRRYFFIKSLRIGRGQGCSISASFLDITDDTPEDPLIGISFHVYLDVQEITKLLVLEDHDSLNYYYLGRMDGDGLAAPVVDRIVIDRTFDAFAVSQSAQMVDEEVRLKSIRVIVVYKLALFKRDIVMTLVVVVIIYDGYLVTELGLEPVGEG